MADSLEKQIKFPTKTPAAPTLSLRRRGAGRSPFEASEASTAARESINAIVAATRSPWGEPTTLDANRVTELEKTLRQLEVMLADRERMVEDAEIRIAEKERDVAEGEALLLARERLLRASKQESPVKSGLSTEEQAALEQLKAELEKQEVALKEAKQQIRDREQFLDESENTLFEKVQAQQEKESELEHKAEGLRAMEKRLKEQEASLDPVAAAALKAETEAAAKRDEFNE